MAADVTKVTGGPAQLQVNDVAIAHTEGGVKMKVSPKQRMRTVDQFGESPVAVIHTGDDVRVTAPLAEWTAAVLAEIYDPGNDQTAATGAKYLGIGRSAGYIYGGVDLKIIPFLTADAAKRCQVMAAVPVGGFELSHSNQDDRVFSMEWAGLVTEGSTDGELIAKINLTTV